MEPTTVDGETDAEPADAERAAGSTGAGAPDPDQRAVAVVERLDAGEFECVHHWFAATFEDPGPDELPEMWDQVTALFGDLEAVEAADGPVSDHLDAAPDAAAAESAVHLRVVLQGATFHARFGIDDAGLLAGFELAKVDDDGLLGSASTALKAGQMLARKTVADGVAVLRGWLPGVETGPTTPDQRRAFVRSTLDRLADGEYEAVTETFAPEMRDLVPPEQLRAGWERFDGEFAGVEDVEYDDEADSVYALVEMGEERVRCTVQFDDHGRVTGFVLSPPEAGTADEYDAPAYVDFEAFVEREFVVGDGLGGTLAVPRGVGPHPAAVVVHGTGAADRDGTRGANRPYRDLAQGLATRGVATLRYDKRPHTDRTLAPEDRVVADAVDAVERLQDDPAVDSGRVVVVGHSLGGHLAPRIAVDGGAAGAVGLAAPCGDMLDLVVDQVEVLAERDRTAQTVAETERAMERVRDDAVDADQDVLGYPGAFWQDLDAYDPADTIRAHDLPVLVCHAGRDWRVPDAEFDAWRALATDHPVETRRYEDCNHVFFAADDADLLDAGKGVGHPVEAVVDDVAAWIRDRH